MDEVWPSGGELEPRGEVIGVGDSLSVLYCFRSRSIVRKITCFAPALAADCTSLAPHCTPSRPSEFDGLEQIKMFGHLCAAATNVDMS